MLEDKLCKLKERREDGHRRESTGVHDATIENGDNINAETHEDTHSQQHATLSEDITSLRLSNYSTYQLGYSHPILTFTA